MPTSRWPWPTEWSSRLACRRVRSERPVNSDKPTAAIVAALRAAGCSVSYLDPQGFSYAKGLPDLLVGVRGRTFLLEVKRDAKAKRRPSQEKWHAEWRGSFVHVVTTTGEALAAVGLAPI
jgi:hypothetical protein